jgi:hypothetical protein
MPAVNRCWLVAAALLCVPAPVAQAQAQAQGDVTERQVKVATGHDAFMSWGVHLLRSPDRLRPDPGHLPQRTFAGARHDRLRPYQKTEWRSASRCITPCRQHHRRTGRGGVAFGRTRILPPAALA